MKVPYEPPKKDESMICPNCGSSNVKHDEDTLVKTTSEKKLKQYKCDDCKISFLPAMTEEVNRTNVQNWAGKMRTSEGINEGRSWGKEKIEYIMIFPKDKSNN